MYDYWEEFCIRFLQVCQIELSNVSYKNLFIFSLIVVGLVHISCYLFVKIKKQSIYFSTELMMILLIIYLGFIAEITILGRTFGSQARVFDIKWLWIDKSIIQNITNLLNIILFIPFGTLFTVVQRDKKSMRKIFMIINYSFLTSLLIECIQFITRTGYFEVDDIEANIVGGLIGSIFFILCYKMYKLFRGRHKEVENEKSKKAGYV